MADIEHITGEINAKKTKSRPIDADKEGKVEKGDSFATITVTSPLPLPTARKPAFDTHLAHGAVWFFRANAEEKTCERMKSFAKQEKHTWFVARQVLNAHYREDLLRWEKDLQSPAKKSTEEDETKEKKKTKKKPNETWWQFASYRNHAEFWAMLQHCPIRERVFFELLLAGQRVRMAFDMDGYFDKPVTREEELKHIEYWFDTYLRPGLRRIKMDEVEFSDLMIEIKSRFDKATEKWKFSHHIIIPKVHSECIVLVGTFLQLEVVDKMRSDPRMMTGKANASMMDMSVYKKTQQYQFYGCSKALTIVNRGPSEFTPIVHGKGENFHIKVLPGQEGTEEVGCITLAMLNQIYGEAKVAAAGATQNQTGCQRASAKKKRAQAGGKVVAVRKTNFKPQLSPTVKKWLENELNRISAEYGDATTVKMDTLLEHCVFFNSPVNGTRVCTFTDYNHTSPKYWIFRPSIERVEIAEITIAEACWLCPLSSKKKPSPRGKIGPMQIVAPELAPIPLLIPLNTFCNADIDSPFTDSIQLAELQLPQHQHLSTEQMVARFVFHEMKHNYEFTSSLSGNDAVRYCEERALWLTPTAENFVSDMQKLALPRVNAMLVWIQTERAAGRRAPNCVTDVAVCENLSLIRDTLKKKLKDLPGIVTLTKSALQNSPNKKIGTMLNMQPWSIPIEGNQVIEVHPVFVLRARTKTDYFTMEMPVTFLDSKSIEAAKPLTASMMADYYRMFGAPDDVPVQLTRSSAPRLTFVQFMAKYARPCMLTEEELDEEDAEHFGFHTAHDLKERTLLHQGLGLLGLAPKKFGTLIQSSPDGSSLKSTQDKKMHAVMGPFAMTATNGLLTSEAKATKLEVTGSQHTAATQLLRYKRYVSQMDLPRNAMLTPLFKNVTGGDRLNTRGVGAKDFQSFTPCCNITLSTNKNLLIDGKDPSIANRVLFIRQNIVFETENKCVEHYHRRLDDTKNIDTMKADARTHYLNVFFSTILVPKAVEAAALIASGKWETKMSPSLSIMQRNFSQTSYGNPIDQFIAEHCVRNPNGAVSIRAFKEQYEQFLLANGIKFGKREEVLVSPADVRVKLTEYGQGLAISRSNKQYSTLRSDDHVRFPNQWHVQGIELRHAKFTPNADEADEDAEMLAKNRDKHTDKTRERKVPFCKD